MMRRLIMVTISFVFVNGQMFYTPNKYEYKTVENVRYKNSIVFDVRACNDAHIALLSRSTDRSRLYEVVIGGCTNTKSVIRKCKQCYNEETYHGRMLDCSSYRSFWIKWENSQRKQRIRVGHGRIVGQQTFLEYYDYAPISINYIGISTGWGATGSWEINSRESIHTPNQYRYHIVGNVVRQKWTTVTVKACNDAHVALMNAANENGRLYEIVIGGWGNTHSCIRRCKQCTCQMWHRGRVLDCNWYHKFWIDWSGNVVRVGKGSERYRHTMLIFYETNPFTINYLGISTGWGATGSWTI